MDEITELTIQLKRNIRKIKIKAKNTEEICAK